jgi:hypothetical protein
LEVGRSQSFLPLRRGLFAGITARENSKLGCSPNDFTPKGLSAEDRDGSSKLALSSLRPVEARREGICNKISTQIDTKTGTLTGRHGLFKARQRAHIFELSLSKRQLCSGVNSANLAQRRQSRRPKNVGPEAEAWGEAGVDLGPGGPAGADSALRPEEGGDFSAPRAMAGVEEAFLALRAAGRGGVSGSSSSGARRRGRNRTGSTSHGANRTGNGPTGRSVLSSSPKTSHREREFKKKGAKERREEPGAAEAEQEKKNSMVARVIVEKREGGRNLLIIVYISLAKGSDTIRVATGTVAEAI